MAYRILHRRWPKPRPVWMIMGFELLGLVPILVLFGIAQPDLYRTKLWQVGFDNQFNSNPLMILYAYANHQPLPAVPFVWSQMLTNFNVAISIVTLFFLLVKLILYIMHVWWPFIGLLTNIGMVAVWTTSVYGQMGPDYADSRYPSPVAWYISKSCSYARAAGIERSCMLAKGTFAVSVYLLFLYVVNLGLAIWAMVPREGADYVEDDEEDVDLKEKERVELQNMKSPTWPRTPGGNNMPYSPGGNNVPFTPGGNNVPFTPRTLAFNTLDRRLP